MKSIHKNKWHNLRVIWNKIEKCSWYKMLLSFDWWKTYSSVKSFRSTQSQRTARRKMTISLQIKKQTRQSFCILHKSSADQLSRQF